VYRHKALFLGAFTPVAAAVVRRWLNEGHEVAAFWCRQAKRLAPRRHDRRRGWLAPEWSVTALSRRHGFPIVDVPILSKWADAIAATQKTGADALISVYFPNVVPPNLLALFPDRAVNFHPAMLPRYRGPNPIIAMVLDRTIEEQGGMTLHAMAPGLDEGDIIGQLPVEFPRDRNLFAFQLALARAAARLAGDPLQRYLAGNLAAVPQAQDRATYVQPRFQDTFLTSRQTAEEIRWRCDTLAPIIRLQIESLNASRVVALQRIIGPPTGEPPKVGLLAVDFDAADARVRVTSKLPFVRIWRQLHQLALCMATPTD